jgi:hypothetical protein
MKKVNTIYQIAKQSALANSQKAIKTVNFDSMVKPYESCPEYTVQNEDLALYFDLRKSYLNHLYHFAKELKIKEGVNFVVNATFQSRFEEQYPVTKISSSEFEIIAAKVAESIASIEKNIYFKTLFEQKFSKELADYKASDEYKGDKNKPLNNAIKDRIIQSCKQNITLDSLTRPKENEDYIYIFRDFQYESLVKLNNLNKFCNVFAREFSNMDDNDLSLPIFDIESINNAVLNRFIEVVQRVEKTLPDYKSRPDNTIIDYYFKSIYFQFDPIIKEILKPYFVEINSQLNTFFQNLPKYFDIQSTMAGKEACKLIQDCDLKASDFVNKLDKAIEIIKKLPEQEVDEKAKKSKFKAEKSKIEDGKDPNIWKLDFPKSAPSFPTARSTIIWQANERFSNYLDLYQNSIDRQLLFANFCTNIIRIIERNQYIKIYHNLTESKLELEDYHKFIDFYSSETKKINWAISNSLNTIDKNIKLKMVQLKNGKADLYTFIGEMDRYSPFVISTKMRKEKGINTLNDYFNYNLSNFDKLEIEFYILKQNPGLKMAVKEYINNYFKNIDVKKIEVRKTTSIEGIELNNDLDLNQIFQSFIQKYEKHLGLDEDRDYFVVSDKTTFRRYQKVIELYMNSVPQVNKELKVIFKQLKYKYRELTSDSVSTLNLKTSRMTKRSSGSSTLVYRLEWGDELITTLESYCILYPVKLPNRSDDLKVIESYQELVGKYADKKDKFDFFVGFLNGEKDNSSDKKFNPILKDGKPVYNDDNKPKGYQSYSDWYIINEKETEYELQQKDDYRKAGESVGWTSPSGYPKLYYFVAPKTGVKQIIIPVKTHSYYLNKYTPYRYISQYIELEKCIKDKRDNTNIKHLLNFRTKLRNKATLSSFELVLKRDIVKNSTEFVAKIRAVIHMQFGVNQILSEEYNEKTEKMQDKKNYSLEDLKGKFETVMSIDVGEKHIATFTLRKIDWDKFEIDNSNKLQSYLPIRNSEKENNLKALLEYNFDSDKAIEVKNDKFYSHFKILNNNYKKKQTSNLAVDNSLKHQKQDFTKYAIEEVSNQIAKVASKHKSIVVFERLNVGLTSNKLGLSIMTMAQRKTYEKLTKIGHTLGGTKGEDIKFCSIKAKKGLVLITPYMTSQTCSKCQFKPMLREDEVMLDINMWSNHGILEFKQKNQVILKLELIKSQFKVLVTRQDRIDILNSEFYIKGQKNVVKDWLVNELLIPEKKEKKYIDNKMASRLVKTLLKTRIKQDTFSCPSCGHTANADYNASENIGNKINLKEIQIDLII